MGTTRTEVRGRQRKCVDRSISKPRLISERSKHLRKHILITQQIKYRAKTSINFNVCLLFLVLFALDSFYSKDAQYRTESGTLGPHATPRRLIDVLASNELRRVVELQQMKRSYDDFSLANRRIELP